MADDPAGQLPSGIPHPKGPRAVTGVHWGSATHQGRVRDHNEDALLAGPSIFAVADGMGGHAAGEIASAIAVAELANVDDLDRVQNPELCLRDALWRINTEIRRRAAIEPGASGMGTTLAGVARAAGSAAVIFNVGDSRVYRLRKGTLSQLTKDHSLVDEMVRAGDLPPEAARTHPQRNVITRALGLEADVQVDLRTEQLAVGDYYLVASDGLCNELADHEIQGLLARPGSVETTARTLLHTALAAGGRDNVSVVLVEVVGPDAGAVDDLDSDTSPSVPDDMGGSPALITAVPPSLLAPDDPGAAAPVRSR